ncbi:MAG: hypothetical protein ACI4WH_03395 [Oscillospiraceae bacterium]
MVDFFINTLPFFEMSLFEMFYYFCFWSVFGWFFEVILRSVETGGFENRGFLNGAFCPIYGFGVLGVIIMFRDLVDYPVIMFFSSAILCTALEWLVGRLLLLAFNTRWWDYSNYKIHSPDGLISLPATLFWGIGCVLMMKFAQPMVVKAVSYIPIKLGIILIFIILAIIIVDIVVTINEVQQLSYNLGKLQELADFLHNSSISMGEKVSDKTLCIKSKYDETVVQYNLLVKEVKDARLTKAFPNLEYQKYKIRPRNLKEIPLTIKEKVSDTVYNTKERFNSAKELVSDKVSNAKEKLENIRK